MSLRRRFLIFGRENISLQFILPWMPTIGTEDVPTQILVAIAEGTWNKVPVMLGTNTNEGTLFVYEALPFMDNILYDAAILALFGHSNYYAVKGVSLLLRRMLLTFKYYPSPFNPITDVRPMFASVLTDWVFACSSRYFSQLLAKQVLSLSLSLSLSFSSCETF